MNITKTLLSLDAELVSELESNASFSLIVLVDSSTDRVSVSFPAALAEAMHTNINNCEIFNIIE